jgi:AraC-like DNA-binding protein
MLSLVGALAVLQAVMLATAQLSRRDERHPAVRALALALLAGAATLGAILLSHRLGGSPLLWAIEVVGTTVSGPLIYGWVCRVLEETERGRWRRHMVLPALLAAYECAFVLVWLSRGRALPQPPIGCLLLVQGAYTGAASLLLARRWREPEARSRRGWVGALLAMLLLVHLASLSRWTGIAGPHQRDIVPAASALFVYALSFLALRQPRLLRLDDSGSTVGERPAAGETPPVILAPRYESSALRADQVTELRARALTHLSDGRAFLRPDLALSSLAAELGTLPTHLSRAINEGGESFPELITRLRVDEVSRLLADPSYDHLTVEALGRRAGFPSRSGFFEGFRRLRGVTPSAFRRERGAARPVS